MPTQDQLTEFMETSYIPFLLSLDQKLQQSVKPLFEQFEVQDGREITIDLEEWLQSKQYIHQRLLAVDKKISFYFIFKKYTGLSNTDAGHFNYDIKTALHLQADKYIINYGSKVLATQNYSEHLSTESIAKLTTLALEKSTKRIRAKAGTNT